MNAIVFVAITPRAGRTDITVKRTDRQEPRHYSDQVMMHKFNVHNNITDASFSRLARLLAKHGNLLHGDNERAAYRVK